MQSDPSSATLITDEKRLSAELHDLLLAEERFYKQKSRIQWLKSGDQNTAYFYKVIKMKQSKNTIRFLYTDDNLRLDSPHEVNAAALNYFWKQLGAINSGLLPVSIEFLRNFYLPFQILKHKNSYLLSPKMKSKIQCSPSTVTRHQALMALQPIFINLPGIQLKQMSLQLS